ncbi:MAG: FAD-binding oxidoreductase [Caldimonas sp.]
MPAEPPSSCSRRTLLAEALSVAVVCATAPLATLAASLALPVENITRLYTVEVARIETPADTAAVVRALREWPGQVAIGGGRYSMGGQIAIAGGLHLDMRRMNSVVWLRAAEHRVRVQAGITWRDLQDVLDKHDLSVRTMQSYANFTVGGAVSVNAHGRYVDHGPIGQSVRALQLVLADGRVVEADRSEHTELLRAALGGYGAIGVVTEVELDLDDNAKIERRIDAVPLADYPQFFATKVLADPASVMHNADLLPPRFDAPLAVTWHRTDKPLTRPQRLVPRGQAYKMQRNALWALTEVPMARSLREPVTGLVRRARPEVAWRNREASLDVAALEPYSRSRTTYALEEFFVPPRHFAAFVREMGRILRRHGVAAVNVSVRHSPADPLALLPWAKEEVFSFVLFYKQGIDLPAQRAVGVWTRELIDAALQYQGRYYLPYQLHATREQFERAYPEVSQLRQLKARVDPQGRFSNALWQKFL